MLDAWSVSGINQANTDKTLINENGLNSFGPGGLKDGALRILSTLNSFEQLHVSLASGADCSSLNGYLGWTFITTM